MKLKRSAARRTDLSDPNLFRVRLTPQMLDYDAFSDRRSAHYLPYTMYFNRPSFRSTAITTDHLGFRRTATRDGAPVSAGDHSLGEPASLLVGGSVPLGYGASGDGTTVASRLALEHAGDSPWLNLGGHCFNSAQELVLYVTHHHLVPSVKRVVIMGGFNSLVMARLPDMHRGETAPYYFCGEYFQKMDEVRVAAGGVPHEAPGTPGLTWPQEGAPLPPVERTLASAVEETTRHLVTWKRLCEAMGVQLHFLVQPLATWVRSPCREEAQLFGELDRISRLGTWDGLYGDISTPEVGREYARRLVDECHRLGINAASLIEPLADSTAADDWLFVDRAHFTDFGQDRVARLVAETVSKGEN
ncbi:hypothetical protein KIH74_30500 [Kineosporia sp. J2-2]|uniref:Inducer of phenazine A n=1 Tax=Kineosporia corallincola TaxID=2835133 RepID=A0ABS5TQD2_9ACTN|nr:hypothetical protein [Kineosporia corallincola]MBT0773315.1 hypothetical protein [Kineosporia corallincola]